MKVTGKSLKDIYNEADETSKKNAAVCRRFTAASSMIATGITIAFLLYDEASLYWMVIVCGLLLLAIYGIFRIANRMSCHRKYLENRLLAEGLRVQEYLFKAGIRRSVASLVPWAWRHDFPESLAVLEKVYKTCKGSVPAEPLNDLLTYWVREQKDYHLSALARTKKKLVTNSRIVGIATVITIIVYICTLAFEIVWGGMFGTVIETDPVTVEMMRTVSKVAVGSLSAATLFAGAYYGKFSLDDTLAGHERMAALFEKVESENAEGLSRDAVIKLAVEELNENITWYAFQSKNGPEINL
ncbi:MAG: hypothetical protein K5796_03785 [Lachnospiraceae bacterium]|nr:hypothetical protein [Lachnospiraceae bacterium]